MGPTDRASPTRDIYNYTTELNAFRGKYFELEVYQG
jgi:hypothetical protein